MNHKERREAARNHNRFGPVPPAAHRDEIMKLLDGLNKDMIHDGERVRLNVDQIMGRGDYADMQPAYRQFVEAGRGKVFTAHPHHPAADGFSAVIELEGTDWAFWYGDLLRADDIQTGEAE